MHRIVLLVMNIVLLKKVRGNHTLAAISFQYPGLTTAPLLPPLFLSLSVRVHTHVGIEQFS